jgi:hypothetical protein
MRQGRHPVLDCRVQAGAQCCAVSQRPFAKELGGSTPVASSPHRGARFASMRLMGIGQQTLPGSIRPPGGGSQETGGTQFARFRG